MAGVAGVVADHVDDLDRVVVTHQHGDHVAELGTVVDAFDPAVYAYADHEYRTHELADGDTVQVGDEDCEVVYSPGHADDHVALVGERRLYSGDVVVHDDGAFDYGSFGRTDYPGQSRERLVESIRAILDRMPDTVEHMYAGHGDPFHGDVRDAVSGSSDKRSESDGVRDVVETALARAEKHEPKYPDE
jgi:glyoxylase-like metal-dependent hydrolase (beta-lactamase superfamily II)